MQLARCQITLSAGAWPEVFGHGGQAAYGFLLEVCRSFDPELARHIHDGHGPKPLSVSPLSVADGEVRLSCGTLDAPTTAGVVAALQEAAGQPRPLALADADVLIADLEVLSAGYADLLERASRTRRIELDFLSPTLFRRSGESLVLPQPELVFGSLLRTWNAFSPLQLPPYEAIDLRTLMISHHQIHTRMVDFGTFKLLGFVGRVGYLLPQDTPPQFRQVINCLADYASFAGVGYRTTMGMGVCRRR
ncbi:MAG: CRISPR system precrRNA processing endoribonuclease RAMP protein Cas6 [Armatimonadota bacterium]